jgi:hypothetical protein
MDNAQPSFGTPAHGLNHILEGDQPAWLPSPCVATAIRLGRPDAARAQVHFALLLQNTQTRSYSPRWG